MDAFGQYLVNNTRVLDALFESLSAAQAREAKAVPEAGDRTAAKAALEKAREGIEQMGKAADSMTAAPSDTALVPLLGQFVHGLVAAREAEAVLQADEQTKDKAKEDETGPEDETQEPVEPPPMTEQEKTRIAKVKAAAAGLVESPVATGLEGEDWTRISRYLERFAAAVEAGFTVTRARKPANCSIRLSGRPTWSGAFVRARLSLPSISRRAGPNCSPPFSTWRARWSGRRATRG